MNQENSVALRSRLHWGELLRNRCAHALGTAGLALMLGVAPGSFACAQTAPVAFRIKVFRKAVTSTKDGTLYVGSFNLGGVVKAAPGGKAEQFIKPGPAAVARFSVCLPTRKAACCTSAPMTSPALAFRVRATPRGHG